MMARWDHNWMCYWLVRIVSVCMEKYWICSGSVWNPRRQGDSLNQSVLRTWCVYIIMINACLKENFKVCPQVYLFNSLAENVLRKCIVCICKEQVLASKSYSTCVLRYIVYTQKFYCFSDTAIPVCKSRWPMWDRVAGPDPTPHR